MKEYEQWWLLYKKNMRKNPNFWVKDLSTINLERIGKYFTN